MNRPLRVVTLLIGLGLQGCAAPSQRSPAAIHHAVFFVLNDSSDALELVSDCRVLGNIPGVVEWTAGIPVDTGRSNVDRAYDVGLHVVFRSAADYQVYVNHPIHAGLVNKWRPRWKSTLIRDFGEP